MKNDTEEFSEVTKEEFYRTIEKHNSISRIIGGFPYTHEYRPRRNNLVIAKTVDFYDGEYKWPITTHYYINVCCIKP